MALTRSPSPNLSKTTSPKLIPQESSTAIRKSGSFHHSTTSICSDIPQKNSATKVTTSTMPSPRASFGRKENEGDPNFSKLAGLRYPAMHQNKPVKSFMAPTISASSKVKSASPRKKILAEKNEDYMKSPCTSVEGMRMEETKSRSEIECGSVALSDKSESGKPDFSFSRCHQQSIAHCLSRSPEIASSDADPSLPSYDPMTNYLSPRPRFLHYKPNPRIEQLNGFVEEGWFYDGDGRQLENSFSGFEDDDEFNQPVQSSTVKEDSPGEFSSSESETEEVQVPDGAYVPEPESRPKIENFSFLSFGRSKLLTAIFILTFLLFYAPWSDSPFMSLIFLKKQSFTSTFSNSSTFFQEVILHDYVTTEGFDGAQNNVEETAISEDVNEILCTGQNIMTRNHDVHVPNELEKDCTYSTFAVHAEPEPGIMNDKKDDVKKVEIEFSKDVMGFAHSAVTDVVQNLQEKETQELEQKDGHLANSEDIKSSSDHMVEFEIMDKIVEAVDVNSLALVQDHVFSEVELIIAIVGVFAAVLIAISSVFFLVKQKKSHSSDENTLNRTLGLVSSNNKTCKGAYGSPTEMSSCTKNSLYFGQWRGKKGHDEETVSHERMQRRESGASSSISYGSFTTYEKLSGRKGSRAEEVMTPVRRSSRVRNQVTSP